LWPDDACADGWCGDDADAPGSDAALRDDAWYDADDDASPDAEWPDAEGCDDALRAVEKWYAADGGE
jgi:hypothetical protein